MDASEIIEMAAADRGVVHPMHPPIIDQIVLTDPTLELKAGTVLTQTASATTFEPAADDDTLAMGDSCVLSHDTDGVNAEWPGLFHGVVVSGRLLDASGESVAAASDTLKAKLPAIGIFLTQAFAGDTI